QGAKRDLTGVSAWLFNLETVLHDESLARSFSEPISIVDRFAVCSETTLFRHALEAYVRALIPRNLRSCA
ncbi:MAG: hypothetical protein U0J65_07480, partial [Christensenellales bacterium]|nr:hypothetical protein [Christensenellales bacterium]